MSDFKHIRAYRLNALQAIFDWITVLPYIRHLKRHTTTSVELAYLGDRRQIEQDIRHGAFFMTNHRDIILDAAFLSYLLRTRYFIRPYIGIGNNLFGLWWIEPLVRSLRCFVVIRDGGAHAQLENAKTLSAYLSHLRRRHKSIWLAQREGRSKDGNDLTQPGVLKMLTLSTDNFFDAVRELNICPVSISYEYDPCDYLKAREMQLRRDNPHWRKSRRDDLISMKTGLNGQKGRVVYRLTPSINPEIDRMLAEHPEYLHLSRNEQIQLVCHIIDRHIHLGYELYERGTEFVAYLDSRLQLIKLADKDDTFLRERLEEMYQNPINNYHNAQQA